MRYQQSRRNFLWSTGSGLGSLAFGNDALAGSSHTLFFTAGPHSWRGPTEQSVHGLLGAIDPA